MPRKFVNIASKIRTKAIGGITGKIFGKIRSVFSGRPKMPAAPPAGRVVGHRGIAAGSLKKRRRLQEEGQQPYTAAEIAQWQNLSGDIVEGFVHQGLPLFVHSSNVIMTQFFPEVGKMLVEFDKGASYLYSNISESEAISFAQAQSKGGWVWDNLRVRGSRTAHRKPYVKIRSGAVIPSTTGRKVPTVEEYFRQNPIGPMEGFHPQ